VTFDEKKNTHTHNPVEDSLMICDL